MLRPSVAAVVIALASASAVHAQDLASICERVMRPPVGAWSEFKFVGGRNDGGTMRLAIVGTERQQGTEYLWLEVAMHGIGSGGGAGKVSRALISKALVRGFGPAAGVPRVSVVKIGDEPAMEMPAGRPRPGASAPMLENCRKARVMGWESVTVPAGTFRALHVANASGHGETWLDPALPFAMVKEADNAAGDSHQMVLIGRGTGARTQITERPRPYDPRLFVQMMMGERAPSSRRP